MKSKGCQKSETPYYHWHFPYLEAGDYKVQLRACVDKDREVICDESSDNLSTACSNKLNCGSIYITEFTQPESNISQKMRQLELDYQSYQEQHVGFAEELKNAATQFEQDAKVCMENAEAAQFIMGMQAILGLTLKLSNQLISRAFASPKVQEVATDKTEATKGTNESKTKENVRKRFNDTSQKIVRKLGQNVLDSTIGKGVVDLTEAAQTFEGEGDLLDKVQGLGKSFGIYEQQNDVDALQLVTISIFDLIHAGKKAKAMRPCNAMEKLDRTTSTIYAQAQTVQRFQEGILEELSELEESLNE